VGASELLGAGDRAEATEVETGTKAPARAGQDEDAAPRVCGDVAQAGVQLADQRLGQGVQLLRPAQRQLDNPRLQLGAPDRSPDLLAASARSVMAESSAWLGTGSSQAGS
jgi:hypothetical protein